MKKVFHFVGLAIVMVLALVLPARAQVAFVNFSVNYNLSTGAGSLSIGVPSGTQNNDGMIACVAVQNVFGGPGAISTPAGWTLLNNATNSTCTPQIEQSCFSRVASSEPASYAWNLTGGASSGWVGAGYILDYRNINPSSFVDTSNIASGAATPATASSVTTAVTNEQIIANFTSPSAFTTAPAGLTERASVFPSGLVIQPRMIGADQKIATPGPSGAKTVGLSGSPACWIAQNIAIEPSVTPPPPPIQNVTVTGTIDNFYGYPCVSCHVDLYALKPTLLTGNAGGNLIGTGPVRVETNNAGVFNASVVGNVTAALYVEETEALFKTTLPSSGTITLAQIQAAQPNVVSAFPPTGNLNMGGNHFINMSGGQTLGDSVAVGEGLGGGAQIFTTSGTYTFPTGATMARALLIGGGGGGGGGASGATNGGGGGGGGTVEQCVIWPANGPATLTVGGGGAGGAATANGTAGQNTEVAQGIATCTAPGGNFGTAGSGGGAGTGGAAASAGTVSGAAQQLTSTVGVAGSNGTSGGGGAGGAAGAGAGAGGNGGAPSSGSGAAGNTGMVILWAY